MLLARRPGEVLTLAESVRYSCLLLKRQFPKARLLLVTPMQTTAAPDSLIHQTGDIIEDCGRRLNAVTVRLDRVSQVVSSREARHKVYTSDGTHTSRRGARHIGYLLADKARTLRLEY